MQFDYAAFAAEWDMSEDELLDEGVPQTFEHLDGKEYLYLPDFYLPELNYWVEIKGPNPTKEELEKAFILNNMLHDAERSKLRMAETEADQSKAFEKLLTLSTFVLYGDVPWPYPQKGNIFGYGLDTHTSRFDNAAEQVDEEPEPFPYRALLMGRLNLCWQECPLCSKVGIGRIEVPYCTSCYDRMATFIATHLIKDWSIEGPLSPVPTWATPLGLEAPQEVYDVTKRLMDRAFFTSGHKTPKLQEAYTAARSARFEVR